MAVALVVTFRHEELPRSLPWLSRLLTLWREPDTVEISLDRLDRAETRALIQALDPLLPAGAGDRITERSAGTPLLVEELIATFRSDRAGLGDVTGVGGVHQLGGGSSVLDDRRLADVATSRRKQRTAPAWASRRPSLPERLTADSPSGTPPGNHG
jgi:hypothetical protein